MSAARSGAERARPPSGVRRAALTIGEEIAAGPGSTVVVEDMDYGDRETYTLTAGPQLDIEAGQVSLASPIGQALVGAAEGTVVVVQTPLRRRCLRVVSIRTGEDRLDERRAGPQG